MSKYLILALFVVGQVCAVGLKPSFDLGFGWTKYTWSYEGYEESNDYTAIWLSTALPYSRVIGLHLELASYAFIESGNVMNFGGGGFSSVLGFGTLSSKIGLIELVPLSPVAPFFKEYITIDRLTDEDASMTFISFGLGFGAELLSDSKVRPILEGHISLGSIKESNPYYGSYTENLSSYGFAMGMRLGL